MKYRVGEVDTIVPGGKLKGSLESINGGQFNEQVHVLQKKGSWKDTGS